MGANSLTFDSRLARVVSRVFGTLHCRVRQQMTDLCNLVDPASSHTLVSRIKPCMSKYKSLYGETANGSLYQL